MDALDPLGIQHGVGVTSRLALALDTSDVQVGGHFIVEKLIGIVRGHGIQESGVLTDGHIVAGHLEAVTHRAKAGGRIGRVACIADGDLADLHRSRRLRNPCQPETHVAAEGVVGGAQAVGGNQVCGQ